MAVVPIQEATSTRYCRIECCEREALASSPSTGRLLRLCDEHREVELVRMRRDAGAGRDKAVAVRRERVDRGEPAARPAGGYEGRVRALAPLARKLDRALATHNARLVAVRESKRQGEVLLAEFRRAVAALAE